METINIAKLKEKLSEVLRRVRSGEDFTVLDRQTPVAVIRGIGDGCLTLARAKQTSLTPPKSVGVDFEIHPVEILRKDRDKRRSVI